MEDIPEVVEKVGRLCAEHRLVLFIGAGCSKTQVGVDWDSVRDEMKNRISAQDEDDHTIVAQRFVDQHGRDALCGFLKGHLLIESFDPKRGGASLAIMSLGHSTIYTTNQDNVLECCFQTYGRSLSTVIEADDFGSIRPDDTVIYKYHGDLSKPDSVVFAKADYDRREIGYRNPMDIRLQSDCLGRGLLFLGYSFRDRNVRLLLSTLKGELGNVLPKSYLVQHYPDPDFAAELERDFGITTVAPQEIYSSRWSPAEAFDLFLADLGKAVWRLKASRRLEEQRGSSVPVSSRWAIGIEVERIQGLIAGDEPISDAINAFRGTYDMAVISSALCDAVAQQFEELCNQATESDHVLELGCAFNNLRLEDGEFAFRAWVAALAVHNVLEEDQAELQVLGPPHLDGLPPYAFTVALALAIDLVREWGSPLSDGMYSSISMWDGEIVSRQEIPEDILGHVEAVFARVYARGKTTRENPLDRAALLQDHGPGLRIPTRDQIFQSLVSFNPKKLWRPYRES